MKTNHNILRTALVAAVAAIAVGCGKDKADVEVQSVTVSPSTLSMIGGG